VDTQVPRPSSARPATVWAARAQSWRADRRIAAALLACVAAAAAFAWYRAGSSVAAPPASSPTASIAARSASTGFVARATTTTSTPALLVVDVVGAVRRNGVVRLPAGSRVIDAVTAAGGATADADLVRLNLAAPVADGARIAVPRFGAPAPQVDPVAVTGAGAPPGTGANGGGAPSRSSPVDINSATAEQLDALPGIGPATAAAIIADRQANGPFRSVDDLGRVRGIGDAKLAQLRGLVKV
jgi:competence protein ComEA